MFGYSSFLTPDYSINNISNKLYHGVYITSNLRWNNHVDYVLGKANKMLSPFKAVSHLAPSEVKKLAYYTICRPILEYGAEVWDPTSKDLITKMEVFQNKVVRFICNIKGCDVSMTEVKSSKYIMTLEKRRRNI